MKHPFLACAGIIMFELLTSLQKGILSVSNPLIQYVTFFRHSALSIRQNNGHTEEYTALTISYALHRRKIFLLNILEITTYIGCIGCNAAWRIYGEDYLDQTLARFVPLTYSDYCNELLVSRVSSNIVLRTSIFYRTCS